MKGRIVKTKVGVMEYYYPQVQETIFFIFKAWVSIGYVSLDCGKVSYYRSLDACEGARKTLRNYEKLYGIELEQAGDYNWYNTNYNNER